MSGRAEASSEAARPDPTRLLTRRLCLRPWREADIDAAVTMDADPAVRRYLQVSFDAEARRARYREVEQGSWPPRGAIWVVEPRGTPSFLGWCGLFPLDNSEEIELGYRYTQAAWGRGVATEAGAAVRDHGFALMGLARELAVTHPANAVSQRVLAKLGFERVGKGFHYGAELSVFRLERAAWNGSAGEGPEARRAIRGAAPRCDQG